jgi:hypothetical protein
MGSAMDASAPGLLRADSDAPVNEYAPPLREESEGEGVTEQEGGGLSSENMKGWWRDLESVQVSLLTEREGWFLQKYKVESDVSPFLRVSSLVLMMGRNGRAGACIDGIAISCGCLIVCRIDM